MTLTRALFFGLLAFLAMGALAALAATVWLGGRIVAAFCAWRRSWREEKRKRRF